MWRRNRPTVCPLCGRHWREHTTPELRAETKAMIAESKLMRANTELMRANTAEAWAIVRARFALAAELGAQLDDASEAEIAAARRSAIRRIRRVERRVG